MQLDADYTMSRNMHFVLMDESYSSFPAAMPLNNRLARIISRVSLGTIRHEVTRPLHFYRAAWNADAV